MSKNETPSQWITNPAPKEELAKKGKINFSLKFIMIKRENDFQSEKPTLKDHAISILVEGLIYGLFAGTAHLIAYQLVVSKITK